MTSLLTNKERQRLVDTFKDLPADQHAKGWDDLWRDGITPWDRNEPSPALIDTLDQRADILGSPVKEDGSRKRALVPGCGAGYDVLLFASRGYDAYGLDTSPQAVQKAEKLLSSNELKSRYPAISQGRGSAKVLVADFFKDNFLAQTGGQGDFDVIYDYTFLVALPPSMRPAWAKRMSELLAHGGHLICLEFPLFKEPKAGGPPHGVTKELFEELLSYPGEVVEYDESGYVRAGVRNDKNEHALIRVDRWKAERTHAAGAGKDHVSVWQHARQ